MIKKPTINGNVKEKNELFKDLKILLNLEYSDTTDLKFFHEGYAANSYKLETKKGDYFVKIVQIKKDIYDGRERTPEGIYKTHLAALKKLNTIKVENISTPTIIAYNNKKKILVEKFIKGEKFYNYLKRNCNKFYFNAELENSFYTLGKFLAKFHNKYFYKKENGNYFSQLHGDLSFQNMLFFEGSKIFLFDPDLKKESIYFDLAKVFINLHILNFFLHLIISKKGIARLTNSFFEGYKAKFAFNLNEKTLKKYIINTLTNDKQLFSRKFLYVLKKKIMNKQINTLIKKLKNNKIKIAC